MQTGKTICYAVKKFMNRDENNQIHTGKINCGSTFQLLVARPLGSAV